MVSIMVNMQEEKTFGVKIVTISWEQWFLFFIFIMLDECGELLITLQLIQLVMNEPRNERYDKNSPSQNLNCTLQIPKIKIWYYYVGPFTSRHE